MSQLILTNSQITAQTSRYSAHRELEGTQQVISVTDLNDATTKLQNALTPLVGSGPASTAATAFNTRQTSLSGSLKHTIALGGTTGMTAVFKP